MQPPAALVPAIPPKRFRGEPPRDEEKKDETAPKPSQVPQEEASHKNPQWLPLPSTPGALNEPSAPRQMPSGAINQAAAHESVPEPKAPDLKSPEPPRVPVFSASVFVLELALKFTMPSNGNSVWSTV